MVLSGFMSIGSRRRDDRRSRHPTKSEKKERRMAKQTKIDYGADVVVLGGGTAGVPAAIAAARNGASCLLIERYGFLGGTATIIGSRRGPPACVTSPRVPATMTRMFRSGQRTFSCSVGNK